jgi:hypothetical protein
MDTAQSSHEKRSIKVKDFLEDFRCAMPDRDLMEKYDLSATGLEKFYNMLLDRNIIDYAEFEERVEEVVSAAYEGPPATPDEQFVAATATEMEALPAETTAELFESIAEDAPAEAVLAEPLEAEASPLMDEPPVQEKSEGFLDKLQDAWLESAPTLMENPEETRFICPSCLYSQEAAFETCPDCGMSLCEFLDRDTAEQPLLTNTIELSSEPELVFAEEPMHDIATDSEMVFADEDLFPRPDKELKADPDDLDRRPIEIPLSEEPLQQPFTSSLKAFEREDFFYTAEPPRMHSAFAEAVDDTLPAFPIEEEGEGKNAEPRCEHCRDALEPEVRRIYDRKGAMSAFGVAVISLVLGCFGAAALAIFDQYSFLRLGLIYATGLTMLLGTVFLGLALFMLFFAREKVFVCPGCRRTYSRL